MSNIECCMFYNNSITLYNSTHISGLLAQFVLSIEELSSRLE